MVDFQSRDTRRTLGGDDEEDGVGEEGDDEDGDGEPGSGAGAANAEGETASDSGATDPENGADTAADSAGEDREAADAGPVPEGMTYALATVGSPTGDIDPADAAVPALDGTEARVVTRRSVEASLDAVQSTVGGLVDRPDVAAVVTFGGVGMRPGDVTPEAVEPLLDKRMDGFGELFRVLAHEREGTAVVRARVTAGLVGAVPVFCLPGDPDAARHGLKQLVLAEAEAIVEEATGGDEAAEGGSPGDV